MRNDPEGFQWISKILGRVDVKQAQNTKVEDRAYILGEVGKLGAVVERMTEFLGAAHQLTVKWQRVLEGMSAGS